MTTIRQIRTNFDPSRVKPGRVARTTARLIAESYASTQQDLQPRRQFDRRCGRDRRQQQRAVLINLRSPHARRTDRRRCSETSSSITDSSIIGIDVYV